MALTEDRPLALPSGDSNDGYTPTGVFTRPSAETGPRSWFTTVDHKKSALCTAPRQFSSSSLVALRRY